MPTHTRTACTLAILWGLLAPSGAFAMPGNVMGIQAQVVPNGVRVTWEPADGSAAKYRVFWSHESILENDALYDDVVETDGPDTSLTLDNLPAIANVYVTVLAVDPEGEESELFEEEAHVSREATSSVAASEPASSVTTQTSGDLRALKVETLSATGVLITFSAPVVLDATGARSAFSIVDGENRELAVYRVKTDGPRVELHTLPQTRRRAYRIDIGSAVRGRDDETGGIVSLASDQTDLLFIGSDAGIDAGSATTPVAGTQGADVTGVQVRASADGPNTYTVELQWQPATGVQGYRAAQTRDGGRTYGQAQMLPANVNAIRIPRAPAGELGLLIQAVGAQGGLSRGVLQRVILPATSGKTTASVMAPPVRSTPPRNVGLPQTGLGSAVLLASAGACAGVQVMRRRRKHA